MSATARLMLVLMEEPYQLFSACCTTLLSLLTFRLDLQSTNNQLPFDWKSKQYFYLKEQ